jgi:hypothetical protein
MELPLKDGSFHKAITLRDLFGLKKSKIVLIFVGCYTLIRFDVNHVWLARVKKITILNFLV